jgi:hypothetical protein
MRGVILALVLLAAGYGCATQTGATASGADREGRFAKSAIDMGTCAALGANTRNPDLYLAIGGEQGDYSIAGSRTKDGAAIWTLIADDAGPNSSTVRLRGSGASAAELDEMWRILKFCETYKPG